MAERQVLISIQELQFFEFLCPKKDCRTSFTLDMAKEAVSFPEVCPACGQTWNSFTGTLPQAFTGYKRFYDAFTKAEIFKARFRVKEE